MTIEPDLALSVRQPWAWAIFHGKDIENRSQFAITAGKMRPRRIVIHASKGMTREEYVEAYTFMRDIGVTCPPAGSLIRGAAIGSVEVVDIVSKSSSGWFMGPRGLVLRDQQLWRTPLPCAGALGYFEWRPRLGGEIEQPAKWMLPKEDKPHPVEIEAEADLFRSLTGRRHG